MKQLLKDQSVALAAKEFQPFVYKEEIKSRTRYDVGGRIEDTDRLKNAKIWRYSYR